MFDGDTNDWDVSSATDAAVLLPGALFTVQLPLRCSMRAGISPPTIWYSKHDVRSRCVGIVSVYTHER